MSTVEKQEEEGSKRMIKNGKAYILVESTKKSKYRKAKWVPEDYDQIDKWKIPTITKEDVKSSFSEESSFAVMFPKYREKYIKECWGLVLKSLKGMGIKVG